MRRINAGAGGATAWIAVLALFAALSVARLTQSSVGHDFFQFWAFGQYIEQDGHDDLYVKTTALEAARSAEARVAQRSIRGMRASQTNRQLYANGVEPISTPFHYAAFASLSSGNYDVDLLVFQLLSTGAVLFAGWFACRAIGYTPLASATALTTLMLLFGPLHADIETGNTNRLQLALLAAAIALHHRAPGGAGAWAGGLLLGASVALKPNLAAVPLFLAVLWTIDRRYDELVRAAAGWVLGSGLACAFAAAAVSWGAWADWMTALAGYGTDPAGIAQSNWSTARLVREWAGTDASVALALILFISLAAAAWRVRARPQSVRGLERDLVAVSAAAVFPLIASPVAWDHYFLLAVPAIVLLLRPAPNTGLRSCGGAIALVLCAINPLRVAWGTIGADEIAVGLAFATALLWLLLLRELTLVDPSIDSLQNHSGSSTQTT